MAALVAGSSWGNLGKNCSDVETSEKLLAYLPMKTKKISSRISIVILGYWHQMAPQIQL